MQSYPSLNLAPGGAIHFWLAPGSPHLYLILGHTALFVGHCLPSHIFCLVLWSGRAFLSSHLWRAICGGLLPDKKTKLVEALQTVLWLPWFCTVYSLWLKKTPAFERSSSFPPSLNLRQLSHLMSACFGAQSALTSFVGVVSPVFINYIVMVIDILSLSWKASKVGAEAVTPFSLSLSYDTLLDPVEMLFEYVLPLVLIGLVHLSVTLFLMLSWFTCFSVCFLRWVLDFSRQWQSLVSLSICVTRAN